jgi:tRNA G10  N-methylase Trm11
MYATANADNTSPGQAIYEPFLGSGTTLIAAQTAGRVCFAIELDPLYVDVAVRRWQSFTGEKATLIGDARSFEEIGTEGRPIATPRNKPGSGSYDRERAGDSASEPKA